MSLDVVPLLSSRCSFPIERNDICFPFSMMDRSFMNEFVWGGGTFYDIKKASAIVNQNIILLSQWIEQLFVSEKH